MKLVNSYDRNNNRSIQSAILFGISSVFIVVLIILSLNSKSEYFSVAVWFVPSIMMITAIALGDGTSMIIDAVFSNKGIKHIGDISFEIFLIHQLVIRYLSVILNKLLNYNGIFIYVSALIVSIICAEIWRFLIMRIKKNRS